MALSGVSSNNKIATARRNEAGMNAQNGIGISIVTLQVMSSVLDLPARLFPDTQEGAVKTSRATAPLVCNDGRLFKM